MADSPFNLAVVYEEKEEWEKVVDLIKIVISRFTTSRARFLDRTIHRSRKH